MNTATKIVATPGLSDDSCGVIAYWSMTGGDCDHTTLIDALVAAGFTDTKEHPPLPTPKVAFWRAVMSFESPTRFLRTSKRNSVFHLVDESVQEEGDLKLTQNVKFSLNAGNMVQSEGDDPEGLTEEVAAEYLRQLERLAATDVSSWLVKKVHQHSSVSLRPSGGFYFIPSEDAANWRKIVACIEEATTYQVFEIPAMPTDKAVEAVLDAILREAKLEADNIAEALQSGDMGARALRTRARKAEEMAAKVEKYEELLGQRIEDYREQLEQLSAQSVQAAIKAEMEDEKDA